MSSRSGKAGKEYVILDAFGNVLTGGGAESGALRVTIANDSTGQIKVSEIIPGTGATNLGKAHNAAHSYSNVGAMLLGVRRDAPTTTEAGSEGNYSNIAVSRYGQLHTLNVPNYSSRTQTFTSTGAGTTESVTQRPKTMYSLQVTGTGAAADAWTVVLEVSLDGSNFTTILTHDEGDGNGILLPVSGVVASYYRARVTALTLGSATNIAVYTLGV